MDFKIAERSRGPVTVLDIVGKLTIDHGAEHLKDKIDSLVAQKRTQIVLNLGGVPHIDGVGLGQLLASLRSVMRAKGALKLMNTSSWNHHLLRITRLVTVFESFDSEIDAVRSFQAFAPAAVAR